MPEKRKRKPSSRKAAGGGVNIGGSVNTGGGDFVGRDQKVVVGERTVVAGRIDRSVIVTGDGNTVNLASFFGPVYQAIASKPVPPEEKADLTAEVRQIEAEAARGEQADEGFLARRLRNLRRMAPDILEVMIASFGGPVPAGTAIFKKLLEKARREAG